MARDENDRPYEDGQGRSLNPDLTGDVLSSRWSTEDTDEQPAIQVVGNETYILPPDRGTPVRLGPGGRDVLDEDPHDVLGGSGAAHDLLSGPGGTHDVLDQPYDAAGHSGSHDVLGGYDLGGPSGPHAVEHSGPHPVEGDSPYLPIDRGYEAQFDDEHDEEPKRGFLGSGWTDDDSDDGRSGGEREVRRRTRKLLVAAAAVVVIGVGAGFMLTGTSSDDPCDGGRCASAGEVSAPADTAAPEDTEETAPEPTDSDSAEPTESESVTPTPTQRRVRPTSEPSARPTRTRAEPTAKATSRPTRTPQGETRDADTGTRGQQEVPEAATEAPTQDAATEAPMTQAPPVVQEPERKGIFDYLFPWA
ncbi:hypothetical protein [Nonomuraea sp. NPDC002799]